MSKSKKTITKVAKETKSLSYADVPLLFGRDIEKGGGVTFLVAWRRDKRLEAHLAKVNLPEGFKIKGGNPGKFWDAAMKAFLFHMRGRQK